MRIAALFNEKTYCRKKRRRGDKAEQRRAAVRDRCDAVKDRFQAEFEAKLGAALAGNEYCLYLSVEVTGRPHNGFQGTIHFKNYMAKWRNFAKTVLFSADPTVSAEKTASLYQRGQKRSGEAV